MEKAFRECLMISFSAMFMRQFFYCLQYYRSIVVSVTESDLSAQETQQNLKDISQY